MAIREHLTKLEAGVSSWNTWRKETGATPDLIGAKLRGANLREIDFGGAKLNVVDFTGADLAGASFVDAELSMASFIDANLSKAGFVGANLISTSFVGADLTQATLAWAYLRGANLQNAKLSETYFWETTLADIDLSQAIDLDNCLYGGPSIIDHRTLARSGRLPLSFLRGIGLPDSFIDYLPSLFDQPIQHYSCFISHSTRDQRFADRLHGDLQNEGARCWFAPHDMPIGGKILDEIDSAIRLRDKVLLILSEHSIKSDWVEDEVTKAFEEERKRGQTVLFPIRLDDAVMDTNEAWAAKLRARHIGDFRRWKEHDEYQRSFARVLRDLTVKKKDNP
jgi:uncharacterized protein YjbI with pentapeptide repeats